MDYELHLPARTVKLIQTLPPDDERVVGAIMEAILDGPQRLVTVLDPYRTDKGRGAIMEDTIKIPDKGITFNEDSYYGCKDQNDVHENYDDMGFTINLKKGVIVLHAIDEPERPEEEF